VEIQVCGIRTDFTTEAYLLAPPPPHRKLGIDMRYHSLSIIKYLEPLIGSLFTTWYTDCIFNENYFLALGGDYKCHSKCQKINWDEKFIISSDPRTKETKLQVQKIINLQKIIKNLPDAFTDYKGVTKSWNHVVNTPKRVGVYKKTTQAPFVVKGGGLLKPRRIILLISV
jgi:hypothetical protein